MKIIEVTYREHLIMIHAFKEKFYFSFGASDISFFLKGKSFKKAIEKH